VRTGPEERQDADFLDFLRLERADEALAVSKLL
jgi:hypothetical protein